MGFPENEVNLDFLVAFPDERLGEVVLRLMRKKGSDYSFLIVQSAPGTFQACQFGKLKLRLKFFPPEKLFTMKLSELSADFVKIPALEKADADLNTARQLSQKNPLHLVILMVSGEVVGFYYLVSRTVYPGKSIGEVFQVFQQQFPMAREARETSGQKAEKPRSKQNVVNTGFTTRSEPKVLLEKFRSLIPESDYYFCLGIGEVLAGSIEKTPTAIPDQIPAKAVLQVVLFSFEGELEIDPQASVGSLELQEDGSAIILRQPGRQEDVSEIPWLLFPIYTPTRTGPMHLRCNIYHEQCLVQSRYITAQVFPASQWAGTEQALMSELDYNLSQSMACDHLSGFKEHNLSLMINENPNGTHGFRFFGKNEFKSDATIDGHEIQGIIDYARAALRKVAWGDEKDFSNQSYRYDGPSNPNRLRDDLISLAIRGYRIYDQIINRLAGGKAQAQNLTKLMGDRGLVQIALRQSVRFVLPAALIYDYPLDTSVEAKDFKICPQFLAALQSPDPLEKCACFDGNCPSRNDDITICPSGFWGFRQDLGMPLSLADAPDAPNEIAVQGNPNFVMSVCLDPGFKLRAGHETRLRNLLTKVQWTRADSRDSTFDAMMVAKPHLVYFYCHGGLTSSNVPFIQIGQLSERGITRDNLRAKGVNWESPRPLVFINGCHTTALEPESAFELVSGFVETSGAAGVIGTEITIFEPIATAFAENFLVEFSKGTPVGEAIRLSRLVLLKQSNPLGLVYIPYTMAGLHIKI